MASNITPTNKPSEDSPFLRKMAANRQTMAVVLLIVGAGFAVIPIVFAVRYGMSGLITIFWGSVLSLITLAAGLSCVRTPARKELSDTEQVRLLLLVLGGVIGFATALYGMALPFTQYRSIFAGGLPEWSKNPVVVWGCGAAVFGGLVLMFVTMLLAREVERSSLLMRRLLYGYNAFFSSFLLLAVLLLINEFCYSQLPVFGALKHTYDWTAGGVYTLSPATQSQLAALKQPVKVIVFMPSRSRVLPALETMLKNCQAVTPYLTWQATSPELMDPEDRGVYRTKYDLPPDMNGMLVIYGTEPKTSFTFVKESELYDDHSQASPFGEEASSGKKFTFKGEAALTTALDYLAEGKSKAVVYFLQGEGELAFSPEPGEDPTTGAITDLTLNLGRGNYDLRPLKLGPETKVVPADATVVVLARPRTPLSEMAVNALRTFLKGNDKNRGKLIALLNRTGAGGAPVEDPGLDALLAEYDVHLGHDRILSLSRSPTRIRVVPDPRSGNTLALRFAEEGDMYLFENTQMVEPLKTNPEYRADSILVTLPQLPVWQQTDFRANPTDLAAEAIKEAEKSNFDRFSKTPLSAAVAVSEAKGTPPPIPGHEFMAQGAGRPVAVVFGDAEWISNRSLEGGSGDANYSLFKSTVDWLREKPTIGPQIKLKSGADRDEFSMDKITPAGASRIEFAPGAIFLLGIFALGVGVALVRRR
jgi:ABC-type uncharacterized transport system